MGKLGISIAASGVLALCGCATDVRTGTFDTSSGTARSREELQVSFSYYLPAATITPSASLRIAGCPRDIAATDALKNKNAANLPAPIKEIQLALKGDVVVEQVQGLPVLIDYRELGDFLKTTNLTLERQPNGMLKSVGVQIEDESPSVLANGAVIAASIALAATGVPEAGALALGGAGVVAGARGFDKGLSPPKGKNVSYIGCTGDTVQLLNDRLQAAKDKAAHTRDLAENNAALAKLLRNTDPGLTPDEIVQVHRYRDRIIDLTAALSAASEAVAEADAELSINLSVVKDPAEKDTGVDTITKTGLTLAVDNEALKAFVAKHFVAVDAHVDEADAALFSRRLCKQKSAEKCSSLDEVLKYMQPRSRAALSADAVTRPQDGYTPNFTAPLPKGAKPQKDRSGRVHPSQGIIYVEPAIYTFTLKQPAVPAPADVKEAILKEVKASVPQLGTYLALPVHAGFGEKVTLNATFNADGSLATASYGRPTSAGKALSGSLAGLAEKYVSTSDAIQERKIKLLKAQADQLNAQKDVSKALQGDPLADLNAQIASITGQAMLSEANIRLNAANSKLSGQ